MACAARLFRIPEPDDNMFPEKVASTANVRRQAADFFGHLRARAAEFPRHVALHWPPMTTPPLGTRCSRWFASQAPRGRRARLGRADEGAQPQRIAPTNENLRGVGARTAFRAVVWLVSWPQYHHGRLGSLHVAPRGRLGWPGCCTPRSLRAPNTHMETRAA